MGCVMLVRWGGAVVVLAAALTLYAVQSDGRDDTDERASAVPMDARTVGLPQFLSCLQDEGVTLISAHRGGPGPGYPENAIATFKRIAAAGPAVLEVDVRSTADGVLMLLHDRDLARTTTCTGALDDTTARAVRDCRLKDNEGQLTGFPIPTLAEALQWARGRAILQLDIKRRGAFAPVVEVVAQADAFDHVIFITYSLEAALEIADLHPDAMVSASLDAVPDLSRLEQGGLPASRTLVWTGFGEEKPDLVAALDEVGVLSSFGTLGFGDSIDDQIAASGDVDHYRRIAATGVDVIASDAPLLALQALAAADDPADDIVACSTAR